MKKLLLSAMLLAAGTSTYAQWTAQTTTVAEASRGVKDITIFDANNVWAISRDGTSANAPVANAIRTTNGGNTWVSTPIDLGDSTLAVNNLVALNMTTAWVSAIDGSSANGPWPGGIWKTTDGGLNWTQQNSSAYTNAASFINVVHFFDANVGISQGDPSISTTDFEMYRTTDGGTTWTAIPNNSLPNIATGEAGYNGGNVGVGNSFWFVTNKGKIYRTQDKGITWIKLNGATGLSDFAGTNIGGEIKFSTETTGCLLKRTGTFATGTFSLFTTTDGGTTWSTTGTPTIYSSVSYIPGTTTLVGTGSAGSGYSNNHGATWTVLDSGIQRDDSTFLNATTGWAGGFSADASTPGGIFKYTGPALSINTVANNQTKIVAYPNPANNVLNLKGASISKVVAFDILGKQVLNQDFSAQTEVAINVSSLKTGMYVLQVTNDLGATETIKFAKK